MFGRKWNISCCVESEELHVMEWLQNMWVISHVDIVAYTFNKNASCSHRSALQCACFYGHLELVGFFVQSDCDINATDNKNMTPLICIIVKAIKYLLWILWNDNMHRLYRKWKKTSSSSCCRSKLIQPWKIKMGRQLSTMLYLVMFLR